MGRYAIGILVAFLFAAYAAASYIDDKFGDECHGVVALIDGGKTECFDLKYPEAK